MSREIPRVGAPSSWSSDESAEGPPVVHNHPLPTSVRVILVVYGLMLGVVLGALFWLVISGQNQDARDRAAVVNRVENDLASAKKAQEIKDAATNEQTRVLVCRFLLEFNQTSNVRALASQFHCTTPIPVPTPEPVPQATVYVITPSSPQSAPRSPSHPATHPTHTPPPTTHPTPAPTCLLPKPVPCVGANG